MYEEFDCAEFVSKDDDLELPLSAVATVKPVDYDARARAVIASVTEGFKPAKQPRKQLSVACFGRNGQAKLETVNKTKSMF
jgi:hypothetical protein